MEISKQRRMNVRNVAVETYEEEIFIGLSKGFIVVSK